MSKIGEYAVHLHDDNGVLVSLLPGDDVPGWAVGRIGKHALASGDDVNADVSDDSSDAPPPKAGKGSGEDKWRAYADRHGVDVSGAEGRDDVIAALDQAGVPVE